MRILKILEIWYLNNGPDSYVDDNISLLFSTIIIISHALL